MKKKSILFLVTEDWYFISHRIKLAKFLQKKGYDVNVCCKNTGKFDYIIGKGINCFDSYTATRSLRNSPKPIFVNVLKQILLILPII